MLTTGDQCSYASYSLILKCLLNAPQEEKNTLDLLKANCFSANKTKQKQLSSLRDSEELVTSSVSRELFPCSRWMTAKSILLLMVNLREHFRCSGCGCLHRHNKSWTCRFYTQTKIFSEASSARFRLIYGSLVVPKDISLLSQKVGKKGVQSSEMEFPIANPPNL